MSSPHTIPRIAGRLLVCVAASGGWTIFGCSGEVGSAPSGKEEMRRNFQAAAESTTNPQIKATRNGRVPLGNQGPRSIKQRVLAAEPGK